MSTRASLFTLILTALLSWGGLVWFTYAVPPQTFAFIALFLILTVALISTIAPIAYTISRLISPQATVRSAIQRGVLFTLIIVLNLTLRALHSWNVVTAVLIVLAVIVVEVMVLTHK